MASVSSECFENNSHDALLMALLEEAHVEDAEDERLGCVIRSLEEEIWKGGGAVDPECSSYDGCMEIGQEGINMLDLEDCSRPMIDDPFDWVDVDVVQGSHYDGAVGNWYAEACPNDIGMAEFGDGREYSPYYYGENSIEHSYCYSPLW